jgi:penicillin-binding protein 1C
MGNFTGETVIGRTGSSVPARIVRELLEFLEAGQPPADFAAPEGWELAPVCALSGMPPGPYCVSTIQEWVRRGASLPPAESEFSAKTPDLDNTRHPWRASLPQSESEFSTKTPDLNNTRHPWRAAGMPPVSKDDSSAQAELYKQIAHGSAICDCDMHTPAGIIYPAEYQAWFLAAQRNGELDYASAPLEIISPRDGFVFFASTEFPQGKNAAPGGSPAARPSIPVEVIGGAADTLTVEYDGKPLPSASRPFVFFLPQERGEHRLAIRCGNEESAVRFSVE